jgi:hypothetical protein
MVSMGSTTVLSMEDQPLLLHVEHTTKDVELDGRFVEECLPPLDL